MNNLSVSLPDDVIDSLVISASPASEEFCREFHDALTGKSCKVFGFELRRSYFAVQDPTEKLYKFPVKRKVSRRMRLRFQSGNFRVEVLTNNAAFGFMITPR